MTETIWAGPFTKADFDAAYTEWRASCGPAALAWACTVPIDDVRGVIPHFERRGYTNPSMMRDALVSLGRRWQTIPPSVDGMFHERPAIVRIQWAGPWTLPGSNHRWACCYTHWVATWLMDGHPMVFDCNSGPIDEQEWMKQVVPAIIATVPRANGGWHPVNILRLTEA